MRLNRATKLLPHGSELVARSPFYSELLYYAKNSGQKCVIWHNPLTKIEQEFIMFYMPKQASVSGNMRACGKAGRSGAVEAWQQSSAL